MNTSLSYHETTLENEIPQIARALRCIRDEWQKDAPPLEWASGLSGYVQASIPRECVTDCTRPGANDEAVESWVGKVEFTLHPMCKSSLADAIRRELREYGAWTEEERDDDAQNLQRMLWGACHELKGEEMPEDSSLDVRLQYRPKAESWALHTGDSSFDQDHRGAWGASCVSGDESDSEIDELARSLVSECLDMLADDPEIAE